MRALVLALVAGCGLAPEGGSVGGPSAGITPWQDLGTVVVCAGEQSLGPPAAPPGGLCVRAEFTAAACTTNAECRSREVCFCGRCTVEFCAAASDCEAPRFCNFAQHRCDLACGPGEPACAGDEQCIAGVCRERCLDSTDCQFGEVCDANTCIGDDCSDASGCLAGERCDLQRIPQQVLEPAPALAGHVLYLDLADPATPEDRSIWRAVSADGIHFTLDPMTPVIEGARAPSVIVDGAETFVYFEDALGLDVARAGDGIAFSPRTTVLAGTGLRAPAAVLVARQAVVYYESAGSIGLATGPLGEPLVDAGIVLGPSDVQVGDGTPGTAFWTPVTELASPHAALVGPDGARTIHLWFSGFGTESADGEKFGMPAPIPPSFSVGFAAAELSDPQVLAVWPYGPVADRVDAFLTHLDELGPAAIETSRGAFRLYYVDATHDSTGFTLGRLGVLGSAGDLGRKFDSPR
ncbi:MAG: hypothetical protein ABI867_34960 [Kofleriaceae bacterium]